jgi:hypothetical protein
MKMNTTTNHQPPTPINQSLYCCVTATRPKGEELRLGWVGGQLTAVNPSLEPALPKWSLFNDGTASVNLSLIILHPTSVSLRGRAIARPSCDYTVILDVDNDDNNGEFVHFHFFFT